jgi:ubiquitin C-terminal hydrolase
MDLSLSIPSKMMSTADLKECLKNFVAKERMEKCGYKCSKCKAVDKMEKDITVYRFPKILVIHLKRFSRREKLTTTVTVPKKLDLAPYGPYSEHDSKTNARQYKLYGMSHHSGSLNGGHYVGDALNIDSNTWYNCNDSHVSSYSTSPSLSTSSAYVLFYI